MEKNIQGNPTISWVVPFIGKDLQYLPGLVQALNGQTRLPDEVLLASSGLSPDERSKVDSHLANLQMPAQHLWRTKLHHAGNARNFGARGASGEYVSFFDADDVPHKRRNELLFDTVCSILGRASEVAIYHGFVTVPREAVHIDGASFPTPFLDQYPSHSGAAHFTFPKRRRKHNHGFKSDLFGLKLPPQLQFSGAQRAVAHGHPTVSSSTLRRVKFTSRPVRRGEDVLFAWNLTRRRRTLVVMIDLPLAAYRNHWSQPTSKKERFERRHPAKRTRLLIQFGRNLVRVFGALRHRLTRVLGR